MLSRENNKQTFVNTQPNANINFSSVVNVQISAETISSTGL